MKCIRQPEKMNFTVGKSYAVYDKRTDDTAYVYDDFGVIVVAPLDMFEIIGNKVYNPKDGDIVG